MQSPVKRTPAAGTGGTGVGNNCTGTFNYDFQALISSGVDPVLQVVGQQVNAQIWSRDPADAFTTNLTNAVSFQICQ